MRYANKKKVVKKSSAKQTKAKAKAEVKEEVKETKVSYMHLIVDYLADGVEAVERRVQKEQISAKVVRRAAEELRKTHGDRANALADWAAKEFPDVARSKGKTPPTEGTKRSYKAQQIGDGSPFLRLPLDVLGVKKGGLVTVEFAKDHYKVYKAS